MLRILRTLPLGFRNLKGKGLVVTRLETRVVFRMNWSTMMMKSLKRKYLLKQATIQRKHSRHLKLAVLMIVSGNGSKRQRLGRQRRG
jgi:hypothetical protein